MKLKPSLPSVRLQFRYVYEIIPVIVGSVILLLNFYFVQPILPAITPMINVVGALIAVVPPTLFFYSRYKAGKQIEQQFIFFIEDLTQSINSGMTLPMSLKYCSKRNYFSLSPYVNELAAQVDWGIPFRKALTTFAKNTRSKPIHRAVTTIIQTYNMGGKVSDTLSAVGKSLVEIGKIKEERTASVHSQIVTSYLLYFVFIFILIILQTFLIPALSMPEIPGVAISAPSATQTGQAYSSGFINFIIVQGFFAGLVTGKMAEGSIVAGFKHSILLITTGYTLFSFTSQFQVKLF
ncbi:MAG: type II secretion system F family protein [Candidatus Aenigmarchaeota archaeon]|nr:type II secretion system F family protein [Candidatus Aenigmarchaeota archaeon]